MLGAILLLSGGRPAAYGTPSVPRALQANTISMLIPGIAGDGTVRGASAIPVASLQLSASEKINFNSNEVGTSSPPTMSAMMLQLAESKATPLLEEALVKATNLGAVHIYVDGPGGGDYKVYTLFNTRVTSDSASSVGGESVEQLDLVFSEITENYTSGASTYHFGWNFVTAHTA
jgi:type VI protein secretion system component Hcp